MGMCFGTSLLSYIWQISFELRLHGENGMMNYKFRDF